MLTKVDFISPTGSVLELPIDDTSKGFALSDIDGTDPVKAVIVSSSFARIDGAQYHSARRETRNLIVKLDLLPKVRPAQDSRRDLYRYFMPKTWVTLRFHMSSGLVLNILGMVESFDSPKFVKDPFAHISILCFDPDFKNVVPNNVSALTQSDDTNLEIDYDGTVETGLLVQINVNRDVPNLQFVHKDPEGVVRTLDFVAPLTAGDVLTISTISGSKGATLQRNAQTSSILWGVSAFSNWTEFVQGKNFFRIAAEGAGVPYTIQYVTKYGGL